MRRPLAIVVATVLTGILLWGGWWWLGASLRAYIALVRMGQANALLQGRDYVIPEDVKAFAHEVLRHRILMTFEALADGVTSDQVVDSIVQAVPVP